MASTESKLGKAIAEIERAAASAAGSVSRQLASIRQMALRSGVSAVTMSKAVREMVRRRKIAAVHGLGLFLPGAPDLVLHRQQLSATESSLRADRGWKRLYAHLLHRLEQGSYEPGAILPGRKEFCHRFGISPGTAHKALDRLCREKRIEPWRRSYRVPTVPSAQFRTTIVVIVPGFSFPVNRPFSGNAGFPLLNYPRMGHNLAALEQECTNKGVRQINVYRDLRNNAWYSNGKRVRLDRAFVEKHSIAGCIVLAIGVDFTSLPRVYADLDGLDIPVSVLDEGSNEQLFRQRFLSFRVMLMGTTPRSGLLAGEYLIQKGHRDIAYVAPSHDLDGLYWSKARLDGLQQAAHQSPCNARIIPITGTVRHLFNLTTEYTRNYAQTVLPLLAKTFDRRTGYAHSFMHALRRRGQDICHLAVMEDLYGLMTPLLEQALTHKKVSVWVCQNDIVALNAIRFLYERGVSEQNRVSVMGFDNTREALANSLTSYSFNEAQAARVLVGTILGFPGYKEIIRPGKPLELDGYIVERDTVKSLRDGKWVSG